MSPSPDEPDRITLDAGRVAQALAARHRQAMTDAAVRESALIEEIANLEAYAADLRAQLDAATTNPSQSGPDLGAWGDHDPDQPERKTP